MTGLDDLKKYIRPSYFYLYASAGLLLLGIFGAVAAKNFVILIILGIVAVLNSISTISEINRVNETIQKYTESGSIDRIVEEFKQSSSYADGHLRMGPDHIFGEKSAAILEYRDIKKAYQYIHKTNFAEDKRELRVETTEGKIISLCKLALRGKSDSSLMTIIQVLLSHNPNIKLGYK